MANYWENLDRHMGGAGMEEIWLANSEIRAASNVRITGDPGKWPTDWLRDQLGSHAPLSEALSIGCGTGAFERDIAAKGIVRHVSGIDVAAEPLQRAKELAVAAGLDDTIAYRREDAIALLQRSPNTYDGIFFHASLHHFDDPRLLLSLAASALKPGGFLYLDEYVGPSRDEWSWRDLVVPNVAYYLLSRHSRRARIVRSPINREDPTEAIASSQILGAFREVFPDAKVVGYGGNLLATIYPNLERPISISTIRRLISLENFVLRFARPFYVVALGRRADGLRTMIPSSRI